MKALILALAVVLAGMLGLAFIANAEIEPHSTVTAMTSDVPLDGECGDLNEDNSINVIDAIWGLRFALDDGSASKTQRRVGDRNLDGELKKDDAQSVTNDIVSVSPTAPCGLVVDVKDGGGPAGTSTSVEVVLHHASVDVSIFTISVRPSDASVATISDIEFTRFAGELCQKSVIPGIPPKKTVFVLDSCNDLTIDTSPQTLFVINLDLLEIGATEIELEIVSIGRDVVVPTELKNATFPFPGTITVTEPQTPP